MKYLVNKVTKEHRVLPTDVGWSPELWSVVQADSEGWIAHTGSECPLPDDVRCEVKNEQGVQWEVGWMLLTGNFYWPAVSAYRPILAEKAQEPVTDAARKERAAELSQIELAGKRMMLLDRLKAAHEHAQTIPDLEAELREVLAGMGYDLVARSPFVEPEPAVETPQEDMSDWRNWREGDVLICSTTALNSRSGFTFGCLYVLIKSVIDPWLVDDDGYYRPLYGNAYRFRFHSRPAKGEK